MIKALKTPIVALAVSALLSGQNAPNPIQNIEPPERAQKLLKYAMQLDSDAKKAVRAGRNRTTPADNGIYVDEPKLYDDSLLQQMLSAAQNRLMSLQAIDQSGLSHAIGNVTGANQTIRSFALAAGEQTIPATSTTPATAIAPVATPPGPTTNLPPSFSGSASDILGEQVQLTAEIANLRLLLEGAISDYVLTRPEGNYTKPRVTLGFPIAITPTRDYKDAVAIVEVFAESLRSNDLSNDGEPPAVTALLPREKTYNVAAISDNSASIGAGYAVGIAGAAASFLWGHKTYFVVKDQDTLAMPMQLGPEDKLDAQNQPIDQNRVRAFAWQFRPVLGRHFVETGSRQVFVQLAFPSDPAETSAAKGYGFVRMRTYWRKIDPKTGILRDIIPDSFSVQGPYMIPMYDLTQTNITAALSKYNLEDLGTGQMLIKVQGRLLPGSYLRVGSNIIQPNSGGVPWDLNTTRFVANIADLATLKTYLISRDGTETPLGIKAGKSNKFVVDKNSVRTSPIDSATTLLQLRITNFDKDNDEPPVILVGGKAFGYSDSPIDRKCDDYVYVNSCLLSVAVPSGLLASSPVVTVKPLLMNYDAQLEEDAFQDKRTVNVFSQNAVAEKLVFLSKEGTNALYLLYGRKLKQAKLLFPLAPASIEPLQGAADEDAMRLVKLPLTYAKDGGPLLIVRPEERPLEIAVPALPKDDAAAAGAGKKPAPKVKEAVLIGSDDATITGDNLDPITKVLFGAKPLTIAKRSPTSLKVTGLATAGATSAAKTQELTLVSLAGSSKVALPVVTNRVDVLAK